MVVPLQFNISSLAFCGEICFGFNFNRLAFIVRGRRSRGLQATSYGFGATESSKPIHPFIVLCGAIHDGRISS